MKVKDKKNFIPFVKAEEKLIEKVVEKRTLAETKFPLIITMAATFGFVSVLYGFEKMIDRVDLFVNHPWILLILGVAILGVTGSLYKKL